jgi:RNA polymerase sigma-70 factor (ECF subfamily)|tara:strand:- start:96 stop:593 length:498 start_codon:yes stop_codon:yes gene_type:complete
MDKDRFLGLVLENKKIIYKICHSYCRDPEDREDLAQEIIIHLWKSSARYDDQYRLSTWIYRVALNVAISFYRREKRRKQGASPIDEHIMELVDDPQEQGGLEDNIQHLYRFIDRLNGLNKALMLLYLDDHSYSEMAEILGITETNVATKISRIKQTLKQEFEAVR